MVTAGCKPYMANQKVSVFIVRGPSTFLQKLKKNETVQRNQACFAYCFDNYVLNKRPKNYVRPMFKVKKIRM